MTSAKSTCTRDPNPPKESCKEQYLFLLEFYVRCIQSSRLAKLNKMFCVPTTVAFRFLDFCPDDELQLTPVDPLFEPQSGIADDVEYFYAGRSVLFALGQDVVADTSRKFKLSLAVMKKMPRDIRPDVLVGKAEVDMTVHFAALRKEMIDNARYPETDLPNPEKCFDDDIPIIFDNSLIGTISIFARISSHGQTIITEFSAPPTDSSASFLFKANDKFCDDNTLSYKCRVLDPMRCNISEILSEASSSGSVRNDCLICKPPKLPCAPCRIPSGAKLVMSKERKRSCSEVGKGEPDSTCVVDSCRPIQTSRAPKEPCGKAVVLKVSGLLNVCNDNKDQQARVTVAPESEATKPDDLADPDHDVFILRIGKKGLVGAGEKSDIQLEMHTPKGPERRPPVRLETREMQTEDDVPSGKKSRKGGKKKK